MVTKTTLTKLVNDFVLTADSDSISVVLWLVDQSAAFDTCGSLTNYI